MKKFLVLALAIVMALSVVALVACAKEETYVGQYSYKYNETTTYGVKVSVTVKGNVIMKVELASEEDTGWVRTSAGWKPTADGGWGMNEGDLGHDAAEAAYADYLKSFKGKTVKEVMEYTVSIKGVDEATTNSVPDAAKLTGATQSAARIILAVQNALSQIPAAE